MMIIFFKLTESRILLCIACDGEFKRDSVQSRVINVSVTFPSILSNTSSIVVIQSL